MSVVRYVEVEGGSSADCSFALGVLFGAGADVVGEMAARNQLSQYLLHGAAAIVRILAIGSEKSCSCDLYRSIPHCYQSFRTFPVRCGAPGGDPFQFAPSWNRAFSG